MWDTVFQFGRYIISFSIVNILLAKIIFSGKRDSVLAGFFENFIKMTLLITVAVYILVAFKIFELISLLLVLSIIIVGKMFYAKPGKKKPDTPREISLWLFDYADGIIHLPKLVKNRSGDFFLKLRKKISNEDKTSFADMFIITGVIAYSGYLRLYDVFMNAAPAMSDAYVTLAWMKYINRNILFYDGIYPQGFHIYQSVIQKFSGLDHLHVLRFTGPLSSVLIGLGIYFAVSRFLASRQSGILAASIYGIFNIVLTNSPDRQVATNAQEFAFVFILPCLYFFWKYFDKKNIKDLYTAGAAFALIGFVHAFAFAFTALGVGAVFVSFLICDRGKFFKPALKAVYASLAAVGLSLIPIGFGLALGRGFHGASAEFAFERSLNIGIPEPRILDYIVFFSLFLLLMYVFFNRKKPDVSAKLFLFIFGIATVVMYFFGGVLTDNIVVESRARELYAIILPVIVAGAFCVVVHPLSLLKRREPLRTFISFCIIIIAIVYLKPQPIIPYKMEHNVNVEQYLRIKNGFRATEWLIVSQEEGYALALGNGWHLMTGDFIEGYDPKDGELIGTDGEQAKLNVPNVFIFLEKNIYGTYSEMSELEESYMRRTREKHEIRSWMDDYFEAGGEADLFFEDKNLAVYHIYQPSAAKELSEKVLGADSRGRDDEKKTAIN